MASLPSSNGAVPLFSIVKICSMGSTLVPKSVKSSIEVVLSPFKISRPFPVNLISDPRFNNKSGLDPLFDKTLSNFPSLFTSATIVLLYINGISTLWFSTNSPKPLPDKIKE